jgi:hypothetical protein
MKNFAALLLCGVLTTAFSIPLTAQTYTTNQRGKTIHVVYDDSGSMILEKGEYRDRWGQAKYAMEVFAAMLEEKDTMRVYFMSDYDLSVGGSLNAPAKITISGLESSGSRVAKIHNTITSDANTSFDTVTKAYTDLKNQVTDEKWLVVLSDGEFNRLNGQREYNIPIDDFFSQYVNESNVKIIVLAMGDEVVQVKPDPNRGIYFEHAKNDNEILGKITSICNRIFNRNKLSFTNEARREFSFDIPMHELLVFAQGADVKINGIKGDGTYSVNQSVNVRYSEVASVNFRNDPNVVISRNLTGIVASLRDIPKGKYSLDIAGESTVEVYYKPVVNIDIKLLKGRKQIKTYDIDEGNYQIRYGIVNEAGDFFESSLLGKVEYRAAARNGGNTVPIKSGDGISLQQGELAINVVAQFLEINTAENTVTHRVITPLPFKERFHNWIKKYWFIFWPLVFLLLALLLYWLLWGRKKRFPKYMSKKPTIIVEMESNTITKYGSFKINPKTKWLPFCPETGRLVAVADGKPLPPLKVKAVGNERMELTNIGDFSPDKLSGIDFYIGDQPVLEGSSRRKVMSCSTEIKSVHYSGGGAVTTHKCSFAKAGRKRKK